MFLDAPLETAEIDIEAELREVLASRECGKEDKLQKNRFMFINHHKLISSFRRLAKDARVGKDARIWLDVLGDPADRDLFPEGRNFSPKHEVGEADLVEAIKATARHVNFFSNAPEPKIEVESIVLTEQLDRALVNCGINMGPFTGILWDFTFHKVGNRWA